MQRIIFNMNSQNSSGVFAKIVKPVMVQPKNYAELLRRLQAAMLLN